MICMRIIAIEESREQYGAQENESMGGEIHVYNRITHESKVVRLRA